MPKIIATIVTYNPELDLLRKNINSFINSVEKLIIIDNNSLNKFYLNELLQPKIDIIYNIKNLGVAEALNIALTYGYENKFDLILTMDQDSYFEQDSIKDLEFGFSSNNLVAISCPSIKDVHSGVENHARIFQERILTTITSGSLCSISILMNLGGFNSKLFIDLVDIDLCMRISKNNYVIIRCNKSLLYHSLGMARSYKFLNSHFISTNHGELRRYYYARNLIYVIKKYFLFSPRFVINLILSFLKTVCIIVLLERRKVTKLKAIIRGITHGILGVYNRIN